MLVNASQISSYPVLSLHIGGPLAHPTGLIVDPNNLKLLALRVDGPTLDEETGDILPMKSVREVSHLGMVIDSVDELVHETDIIKIKKVLELNFNLLGLKVVTKKGTKLGKIVDFTLDLASWDVWQLTVQRPMLKGFIDPELLIARTSILEVNDYEVVVKDEHAKARQKSPVADAISGFVNPFRSAAPAPSPIEASDPKDLK